MIEIKTGLDPEMLNSLQELLGVKFKELIRTYISDSEKRLQRLSVAVPARDFNAINHEAHGMKGSSRNLGANDFAELCSHMEAKGRTKSEDDLEQLFTAIEQSFAAICRELKEYL